MIKNLINALFFLLLSGHLGAQPGADHTSVQDGDWGVSSTWNEGGSPDCNLNDELLIDGHTVTCNCDPLDITGQGSITIKSGGELIVTSNTGVTGNGDLIVESGGKLTVKGNLDFSGNGDLTLDGEAEVEGDFTFDGGTIDGSGDLTIGNGTACDDEIELNGTDINCTQNAPLPVELLNFTARGDPENNVSVVWSTASETNSHYFKILRSKDGEHYREIGKADAAGTSNAINRYQHTDTTPPSGTSYYKLKQVDFNGDREVFGPVAANSLEKPGSETRLTLYPNPSKGKISLELAHFGKKEVSITVRDMLGKEYASKALVPEQSQRTVTHFDLRDALDQGIYVLVVTSEKKRYKKKLVIR